MPPTEANNRLAPRKRIRSKPFKTPMTWDEKRCKNFNMAASPRGIIATTTIYSGKQPPSSPPFGCGYAALGNLLCKSVTPPLGGDVSRMPFTVQSIDTASYEISTDTETTVRFGTCLHRNRRALLSLLQGLGHPRAVPPSSQSASIHGRHVG